MTKKKIKPRNCDVRGGSWVRIAEHCRSLSRNYGPPSNRVPDFGFRLIVQKENNYDKKA